jgi:hypothetical protein
MHRAEITDEEAWHCLSDVGVEPSHHIAQLWMAIYIDRKLWSELSMGTALYWLLRCPYGELIEVEQQSAKQNTLNTFCSV